MNLRRGYEEVRLTKADEENLKKKPKNHPKLKARSHAIKHINQTQIRKTPKRKETYYQK